MLRQQNASSPEVPVPPVASTRHAFPIRTVKLTVAQTQRPLGRLICGQDVWAVQIDPQNRACGLVTTDPEEKKLVGPELIWLRRDLLVPEDDEDGEYLDREIDRRREQLAVEAEERRRSDNGKVVTATG